MTKPLVRLLLPPPKHLTRSLSSEPSTPSFLVPILDHNQNNGNQRPNPFRAILSSPSRSVHHYWRKFDNAFMRPVFGGRGFVPVVHDSAEEDSEPQWEWERTSFTCTKTENWTVLDSKSILACGVKFEHLKDIIWNDHIHYTTVIFIVEWYRWNFCLVCMLATQWIISSWKYYFVDLVMKRVYVTCGDFSDVCLISHLPPTKLTLDILNIIFFKTSKSESFNR